MLLDVVRHAGDKGKGGLLQDGYDTYAAPRAKHEMTAIFSVFRIWSFQTDLMGKMKMKTSVTMLVAMSDLSTRIWSMQCPRRSRDHCCLTGLQRKMKLNVKAMAQIMTREVPSQIQ